MEIKKGTIVRSIAGHDNGDFQLILDFDEQYATVCDGKHRPLEKPKRKKLKHLNITNKTVDLAELQTNKSIRKILRPFIEASENKIPKRRR